MGKWTRRISLLAVFAVMFALSLPESTWAQTDKVAQKKDIHGRSIQKTYITYKIYKGIYLNRKNNSYDEKTSNIKVRFNNILTVSSLGEVSKYIKEPSKIDKNTFPDGNRFIATISFEGMTLKYAKRRDELIRLTTVEMTSPDWSLKVGGTELRPGMKIDQLSSEVRQSINGNTFLDKDDVDGVGVIHVAEPGKGTGGSVKLMEEKQTQISVHVNKDTGTVKVVRFHRIV